MRSTDPKIAHPDNPDLLRQVTAVEHARIKGVPEHLVEGLSSTVAHQVLGQGIVYAPFQDVGQHVGNALNRFAGRDEVELENRVKIPGSDLVSPDVAQMAGEVVASLQLAAAGSMYVGRIMVSDTGVIVQDAGRGVGVVHQLSLLDDVPKLGAVETISYSLDKGRVETLERKKEMGLGICG